MKCFAAFIIMVGYWRMLFLVDRFVVEWPDARSIVSPSTHSRKLEWWIQSFFNISHSQQWRDLCVCYILFKLISEWRNKKKIKHNNTMISGFFRYLFDFSCVCVRSVGIHLCVIRAHCLFISLINENLPLTRASQWVSERKGDAESETSEQKRIISRRQRICMSFVFQFSSINQTQLWYQANIIREEAHRGKNLLNRIK